MSTLEDLQQSVKAYPTKAGVYVMKDFDNLIIYVGKAKNLRARVRSYFNGTDERYQIQYLLKKIQRIDYIITETEEEAFLLERDLIHKHKPRYNIRLKDDKAFLSVKINRNHPYPRLELVRQIIPEGSEYYGPFANTTALREVLDVINKVVPIRTCADTVFSNRTRPCLEYEIKRCSGPCCLEVDKIQYDAWLQEAVKILEGNIDPIIETLTKKMEIISEDLRFEEAAVLRDRIDILQQFKDRTGDSVSYDFTCDVFALYREEGLAVVSILKARDGKMSQVESYDLRDIVMTDQELLSAVIEQYYDQGKEVPAEIILPFELEGAAVLQGFLQKQTSRELLISAPQLGAKHRLVRICEINAKQQFNSKFFSEARFEQIANEMMVRFKLSQAPRTIECFDISNFQGSDIVGAHVAFQDGSPFYSGYRKFTISFQDKPNDFEAMHEAVTRRLTREDKVPDLIVIDGGKQQLRKACEARDAAGIKVDIISIAKLRVEKNSKRELSHKPERIFIENADVPIPLEASDSVTHFLERMRNEVHRYVINYHRKKRAARVFKSVLDEISGVGPERKRRLLTHFGSIEAIAAAEIPDIARVGRMPASLAEKVKKSLQ